MEKDWSESDWYKEWLELAAKNHYPKYNGEHLFYPLELKPFPSNQFSPAKNNPAK